MINLRIGIPTRHLGLPLRRALETAARIGAEGVQIDLRSELPLADCSQSALREIRKLLGDYELRLASVSFPTRRGFGDANDAERRLSATMQAMTLAQQLGAGVVVSRVGPICQDPEDPASDRLRESLIALARHGERVGARLAAQTGADSPEALATLIGELPEGALGVDFHGAQLVKHGHTPKDALENLGAHTLHVTAADAVHDLSTRQAVDVPLGRGMVDLPELLAGLEQRDYRGWITVECGAAANAAAEMADAVEYLRTVIRGE